MKINKKNFGEYIGYFSIALVCVLSLVLSFGIVELYQQPIVANAQVIDGIDYPSIDFSLLPLIVSSENTPRGEVYSSVGYKYFSYYLGADIDVDFVPYNSYYITFENGVIDSNGFFIATDNYNLIFDDFYVVSSFSIFVDTGETSNSSIAAFIVFNYQDLEYYILLDDALGELGVDSAYIYLYSLPSSDSSDSSFADSFFSSIGDGISYGFESLTSGITYTMDNLFLTDGELSDFSIMLFLLTGVSLAMAVLKFILGFVFNWRDK